MDALLLLVCTSVTTAVYFVVSLQESARDGRQGGSIRTASGKGRGLLAMRRRHPMALRVLGAWRKRVGRERGVRALRSQDAAERNASVFVAQFRIVLASTCVFFWVTTGGTAASALDVWEAGADWIGWIAVCLVVPHHYLYLLLWALVRRPLRVMWLGATFGLVFVVAILVARMAEFVLEWLELWLGEVVVVGISVGVIGLLGLWVGFDAVRHLLWLWADRRRLAEVKGRRRWTREDITALLSGLATARGRARFVRRLDENGVRPTGAWPGGKLPDFGHDMASVELARLEELWLGLNR